MERTWNIRPVASHDVEAICSHRERMFAEAGRDAARIAEMRGPFREWVAPRIASGHYFGFVAESGREIVGGVGLLELDWAPHPLHPRQSRRGYVLNVFVEPAHRGAGCARALMRAAQDEFKRRGIAFLALHATAAGRPLYEAMGWSPGNEMTLAT